MLLQGWRPRGDSLIVEHQWELEKLNRLEMVQCLSVTVSHVPGHKITVIRSLDPELYILFTPCCLSLLGVVDNLQYISVVYTKVSLFLFE